MTVTMEYDENACPDTTYSVIRGAKQAIRTVINMAGPRIPAEIQKHIMDAALTTSSDGTQIYFPCPFKEIEAIMALKTVEASAAAAIADLRYGGRERKIEVNLEKSVCFLFSTYKATIGGLWKQDPNVKSKLKGRSFSFLTIRICVCGPRPRHGSVPGTVHPVSKARSEPLRDQEPR